MKRPSVFCTLITSILIIMIFVACTKENNVLRKMNGDWVYNDTYNGISYSMVFSVNAKTHTFKYVTTYGNEEARFDMSWAFRAFANREDILSLNRSDLASDLIDYIHDKNDEQVSAGSIAVISVAEDGSITAKLTETESFIKCGKIQDFIKNNEKYYENAGLISFLLPKFILNLQYALPGIESGEMYKLQLNEYERGYQISKDGKTLIRTKVEKSGEKTVMTFTKK